MKNRSLLWKYHRLNMLSEIVQTGHIQSHYVHSCGSRIAKSSVGLCCIVTCCIPCILWDACCFYLSKWRLNSCCRWGCSYKFLENSYNSVYKDKRLTELASIYRMDVDRNDLHDVASAYLSAFYYCLSVREHAKANIIRAELVDMVRSYSNKPEHTRIEDDGNIEDLEKIVYDELRV